ncbi:MAG: hypothetical protein PHD19_06525 [Dechloromonas sp.]|nr:hypothetical protein [Dechloromonas sp.]
MESKASLGRPFANNAEQVRSWLKENAASIAKTAEFFGFIGQHRKALQRQRL